MIRFGLFEADLAAAELRKNGLKVKLQDRPFEILRILLERPGEVITREEFRQRLWPADTFVDFDHSLNASINKLRQAVDDEAENPRFVATAGRRGYRFIAPATTADRSVPSESAGLSPVPALPDAPATPSGTKLWRRIVPIATLLAMASAAFFWRFPWRARAALGETDSVLVADFVNATGDPVFDGSLKQALTVKLSESPYFNVLLDSKTRETLQLMGRSSDERVVPPVSREICQRAGAKVLIGGSIVAVGNKYAVSLDSTNCLTGASFSHDEVKAESKETVLTALGQIIPKLRRNLGESLASLHRFDTPIEQATTPSLAALKAYTQGDKMRAEGKEAESIPLYKMAIDLDANFAIAYARLGAVYSNLQDQTNQEKYLRLGFERRSHISEREKFYIAAHYYVDVTGEIPRAIDTYELWTQIYMHDWIPFNNLCNEYSRIGQPQKAVVAGQTALRLNPRHSFPYATLSLAYQRSSRFPEAKAIGERAIAEKLDGFTVHRVLYEIAFAEHDSAAIEREAAWFKGKPNEAQINNSQARGLMMLGQVRKAREAFQRSAETARSRGLQGYAAGNLGDAAKFEAVLGIPAEARADLAAWQKLNPGNLEDDPDAALVFALAGDTRRAEAVVRNVSAKNPLDTLVINANVATARAILDLTRNNPAAAVDALRPAIPFDLSTPNDGLTLYYRGLAYLKLGAGKEAAAEFQKVLDNPGVTGMTVYWSLSHLGLARAYSSIGDTEKSLAMYREFLTLWKNADPDLTMLKEAKRESAKLATSMGTPN